MDLHMARKRPFKVRRAGGGIQRSLQWLVPGLGVKRWIIPIFLGILIFSFGLAIYVLGVYRQAPDTWWVRLLARASLRPLSHTVRALIFGFAGTALILGGMWGLNRALLAPFSRPDRNMFKELTEHRRRDRGPKIVAIGGGHGLSNLLRGLKAYSYNITAVVTVADDGGSSGRLRRSMGILPPGDIRNCLAALSDEEALLGKLFQYRFPSGEPGLEGHSFGNLFIYSLSEIMGSFERAVAESGKVLSVHGQVLPATLHDVRLVADFALPLLASEVRIEGESQIPDFPGKINHVWLEPNNPPAYPQVIQALLASDLIIVGPGSLYTSLLPNLLVPDIAEAIRASRALKIMVCNLATQPGETNDYNCEDHIRAIERHGGKGLFDVIVSNNHFPCDPPEGCQWVAADLNDTYPIYQGDLVDESQPYLHNPQKLAKIILDLYQERTGPLVE